jgi:hypothetical protein
MGHSAFVLKQKDLRRRLPQAIGSATSGGQPAQRGEPSYPASLPRDTDDM